MTRPAVYLDSLGCEKNLVDSEAALGLLSGQGFDAVGQPDQADLLVVNTCGFLATAREESLDRIRELAAGKGDRRLVVMGCLVQAGSHDIQSLVPEVDHVLGVGQYHRLAELYAGSTDAGPLASPEEAPYAGTGTRATLTPRHVAYLKIAEGCNQSCSFCRIPALRGRQRSRPVDDLVREATTLAQAGTSELILIAQNSSTYGVDLPLRQGLGDLCRALSQVDGIRWLRILYAYPALFHERLAEEVYGVDAVASYLDIPVQHASPPVLSRMNRGYDPERLKRQIERLRKLRPGIMLRTTALMGFPGETEDDVVAMLDFLADVEFDHLGTFVYSHEEGAPSHVLVDDVDASEKEDRRERVQSLQWEIGTARKERLLGKPVEVVVDAIHGAASEVSVLDVPIEVGPDVRSGWDQERVAFGRSEGFCYDVDGGLWFPGEGLKVGDRLTVVPRACGPYDLLAERVAAAAERS